MTRKSLGRGFSSLIPTDIDASFDPTAKEDQKASLLKELPLKQIAPDPDQPRRDFRISELEALAGSIREHGVLQPIVVTKDGKDKYKIVAGERRWRSAKMAGLETIPAIVRSLSAQNRLELSLIENVQREDLNAIETATAYAKLKDQFNLDIETISTRVGKSVSAIVNTMRLLNLPEKAKHAMIKHHLSEGQMRPLITATPEEVSHVLPKIIAENWSSRRVEQYMVDAKARRIRSSTISANATKADESAATIASSLSDRLGLPVKIHSSHRGSGNLMIKFKNKEEFEKICSILTA